MTGWCGQAAEELIPGSNVEEGLGYGCVKQCRVGLLRDPGALRQEWGWGRGPKLLTIDG